MSFKFLAEVSELLFRRTGREKETDKSQGKRD
jgi:hypothetical protein